MGLTIHYKFNTSTRSVARARKLVEALREQALQLPFQEVGEIVEFKGDQCRFNRIDENDDYRWLKIQAGNYARNGNLSLGFDPLHIIAFSTNPGDGCEQANFGLCLYPGSIERDGEKISTGMGGSFSWGSFCKTQYASDPECGGVKNFLKCHIAIIALLDHAKSMGILKSVSDESDYWDKRDLKALAGNVGEWNGFIASLGGALKDALSGKDTKLESEIGKYSNFEHLEAGFEQKNPELANNIRKTAGHIVALMSGKTRKEGRDGSQTRKNA